MKLKLFSSLYGMLPSAKNYLTKGGYSPEVAAWILIACFLAGVMGIQFISRLLHHFIPSHVVDCDHTHEPHDGSESGHESSDGRQKCHTHDDEETPLLHRDDYDYKPSYTPRSSSTTLPTTNAPNTSSLTASKLSRPSLQTRLTTRVSTFVSSAKASCDKGGPCYGYGDPCGQACFKAISRSPSHAFVRNTISSERQPRLLRNATAPHSCAAQVSWEGLDDDANLQPFHSTGSQRLNNYGNGSRRDRPSRQHRTLSHSGVGNQSVESNGDLENGNRKRDFSSSSTANPAKDSSQAHHHHVPTNAFLSIGLQTSIAIALHKLPEGFITYATNHANPKLGFTVFMALFIHNITEGFAMALPLYLAIESRWKAIFWSSLLGGISQPLGAGVAALWFKLAGRGDMAPGEGVYGGMFAVTAGIMTSVALQLFSEGLGLTHHRNRCITFAFLGMAILGVSFALTAD